MPSRSTTAATWFPLLLAGLLAGLSYWLEMASRAPSGPADGISRHDPDYIIRNFELRRYDPQGELQHTVVADLMRHYPGDDSAVVLGPRITYHRTPPTHISAREARIARKGEHVELIDDVRVTRSGVGRSPDTVLTTTRLDIWPNDEIAKSNAPVTLAQGESRIQGSGLSADHKTALYILEGPVQGVFFRAAQVRPSASPAAQVRPSAPATAKSAAKARALPKSRIKPRPQTKPNATARR